MPDSSPHMKAAHDVFQRLTEEGRAGQMEEQGGDNYYLTDPLENRNFAWFLEVLQDVRHQTGNNKVLVAGCGDGLEAVLLAGAGFEVTAFDFASNMVEVTRRRIEEAGYTATLYVDDVTNLDLSRYASDFAGVMFAQVAQFIPVVEDDRLLQKALADLASLVPSGVIYVTTTLYDDPEFVRPWVIDGEVFGETTYFARPAQSIIGMLLNLGFALVNHEHFDAGSVPPDDYKNDYIIARNDLANS